LSAELNETSGFYVRVGDCVEAVASVASSQALTYTMKVGERAPLYAISGGKIVLAHMRPEETKSYFARVRFEAITPRTITAASRLREELTAARRDGFAYSQDEFTLGITGIAMAVSANDKFIGALNLAIPTARFGPDQEARFRRHMTSVATALTQTLQAFRPV
jgi:DNA-binding IclR family transcriptional regulator